MKLEDVFIGLYKTFKDNNNRLLVAVCGRQGTGKSTITKYLADRFKESGVVLRVFTSEENGIWPEKDRFAVAHRDGSIYLTGQKIPDKSTQIMNIFDELDPFEDFRLEYTDPNKESDIIATRDVNGFLTYHEKICWYNFSS